MDDNTILSLCFTSTQEAYSVIDEGTKKLFQQLCEEQGQVNQCQAILRVFASNNAILPGNGGSTPNNNIPHITSTTLTHDTHCSSVVYNVTLSGPYQKVMLARGAFLRNCPLKPKVSISVDRELISEVDTSSQGKSSSCNSVEGQSTEVSSKDIPANASQSEIDPTTRAYKNNPDTHPQPSQNHSVNDLSLGSDAAINGDNTQQIPDTNKITGLALPEQFKVLPEFKAAINDISAITKTTITLLSDHIQNLPPGRKTTNGFGRQGMVELQVAGTWENAEAARLLLLVVIDKLKPGIVADKLSVDLKFQNMMGGKKRQVLQELMSKTSTRIYLTSPLVQTANKSGTPVDSRYNEIYITGEASQVAAAKEILSQAYYRVRTASLPCTRQVNIATRKLDWMLLNHREKLRSIMIDNATFIAFPPLGGTHPIISVYGESSVNVERTIRTIMQLSCHFHSGSITMRDIPPSIQAQQSLPSFINICKNISQVSGSEVEFRNNGFLMFGSGAQVRTAMQYLTDTDIIKTFPFEFKFSVELANEHREFISGKKNGKINRIMKATGAKIKFDQCNEYNFYVDLSSSVAAKSVEALVLLQEELPAEISFFVPEACHKRIIGVGGKNIQRIMKKYGVYVKFSNFEEYATLGGYFDNLDNVVARTPSKNSVNLENLKQAVMELVNAKDKDFVCRQLLIPRHLHLSLMCDNSTLLYNIHETTNATILFPAPETGSDNITVSGPESLIHQAIEMLLGAVEEQYVFPVNHSASLDAVLKSSEYKSGVVDVIKQKWGMVLTFSKISNNESTGAELVSRYKDTENPSHSKDPNQGNEHLGRETTAVEDAFIFKYTRNHEENLADAKVFLEEFLSNHNIETHKSEQDSQRSRLNPLKDHPLSDTTRLSGADFLPDCHSIGSSDYVLFDNTGSTFDSIIEGSGSIATGSVANPEIRSRFSQGLYSGFNSIDTSPRWPDHSRHLSAYSGSSSSSPGLPASNTSIGTSGISQSPGSPGIFARPTSSSSEIWASGKPQRQSQTSVNHLGSIGDLRTNSSGHYSPGGHPHQHHPSSLLPSDIALNKPTAFHTNGSNNVGGRYSGGNSPVQNGIPTNLSNHGNAMSRQGSPQHTPSQRNHSGSSVNRASVQFLEDSILSGSTFGPGYGPSLNSGGGRFSHQQHLGYQQPQQQNQFVSQNQHQSLQQFPQHLSFTSHLQPQNGFGYPNQRQRHSSQNSAASHHTMGLGPIGRGPGSAGGSVNSDEVSTEDDSDEVFDEMRNRYRMQSAPATMFQQSHILQSNGLGGGYEGYSSHNSSSSSLLNRRGSGGSAHSINFHQQQPFYPQKSLDYSTNRSSSSQDLFGQFSLVNAMEKHTLNGVENDLSSSGGRNSAGGVGQNHGLSGATKTTSGIGAISGVSRFDDEFFSNGFGGIIGDRTQTYGHVNGNLNGSIHPAGGMRTQLPAHRGSSTNFAGGLSFNNDGDIFGGEINSDRSRKSVTSTLSASASPFYIDSSMSNEQSGSHTGESGRWDY